MQLPFNSIPPNSRHGKKLDVMCSSTTTWSSCNWRILPLHRTSAMLHMHLVTVLLLRLIGLCCSRSINYGQILQSCSKTAPIEAKTCQLPRPPRNKMIKVWTENGPNEIWRCPRSAKMPVSPNLTRPGEPGLLLSCPSPLLQSPQTQNGFDNNDVLCLLLAAAAVGDKPHSLARVVQDAPAKTTAKEEESTSLHQTASHPSTRKRCCSTNLQWKWNER